jgi:Poxvirus A32 protein
MNEPNNAPGGAGGVVRAQGVSQGRVARRCLRVRSSSRCNLTCVTPSPRRTHPPQAAPAVTDWKAELRLVVSEEEGFRGRMNNKWADLATKVLDAFGSVEAVKAARAEIEEVIVSGLSADQQAALADDFVADGRSMQGKAAIKALADRAGVSPAEYVKSPEHKGKVDTRTKAKRLLSNYWNKIIDRISPPEEREIRPMTGNLFDDLALLASNHNLEDEDDFVALMNNLRLNQIAAPPAPAAPVAPIQRNLFPAPIAPPAPPPTEPDPTPRDVSFLVNALHNPHLRYPSILALGRAGSGKTFLIREIIKTTCSTYAEADPVKHVIVVSGTATVNPAQWQGMRIETASFRLLDYDADEVKTIWEQGQATKEHTIIVFDDVTGLAEKDISLTKMYTQGRHCKMQVMLLAQSIRGVANPTVRGNAQCLLFTRLNDDDLSTMFKIAGILDYSNKVFIAWNKAYSRSYAFTATLNGTMFLVKANAFVPITPEPVAATQPLEEDDDENEAESEEDDDEPIPLVSSVVKGMTTYQREAKDETYYFHQTPPECAKECIARVPIVAGDRVLEPFCGEGAFYDNLPDFVKKDWCEITRGRDFQEYDKEYDWVITNPPFRLDEGDKKVNAFWFLLDFYTQRAKKGVAFLCSEVCLRTLTPLRLQVLKDRNWAITSLTTFSIQKWRGRYYLIVFQPNMTSIMGFVSKSF